MSSHSATLLSATMYDHDIIPGPLGSDDRREAAYAGLDKRSVPP